MWEEDGREEVRSLEDETEGESAVLNADDPATTPLVPAKPHVYWFSRKQRVAQGAYVRENEIVFRHDGKEEAVLNFRDIPLAGAPHGEKRLGAGGGPRLPAGGTPGSREGVRRVAGVGDSPRI